MQVPVTVLRPVVAQYDPAVHDEQLKEPVVAWKYPARQLEHIDADVAEYVPVAQFVQLDDVEAPVVERYVPATQLLHIDDPVEA